MRIHDYVDQEVPILLRTFEKRLAAYRAITSRSTITPTWLVNTCEWGDFEADPHELVANFFDAFLY